MQKAQRKDFFLESDEFCLYSFKTMARRGERGDGEMGRKAQISIAMNF
jgi:hypothetical protein